MDIDIISERTGLPKVKGAYRLGNRPIRNVYELVDNIYNIPQQEATWIADWLEYLGDVRTARAIYERPELFRKIVFERYRKFR